MATLQEQLNEQVAIAETHGVETNTARMFIAAVLEVLSMDFGSGVLIGETAGAKVCRRLEKISKDFLSTVRKELEQQGEEKFLEEEDKWVEEIQAECVAVKQLIRKLPSNGNWDGLAAYRICFTAALWGGINVQESMGILEQVKFELYKSDRECELEEMEDDDE